MKRRAFIGLAVLFSFPLFVACGKGGSATGPTTTTSGGNEISPQAAEVIKSLMVVINPNGSVRRWLWNNITYSVEDDNNSKLISAADAAADFWNRNVGVISLSRVPKGEGQIKIRLDSTISPHCGLSNISGQPAGITGGSIAVRPGCEGVLIAAHEFGHIIGIWRHAFCGVMFSAVDPTGPRCSGGYTLTEGPAGLFEALRWVYSHPPGTPAPI